MTKKTTTPISFATVLATSVHDMKNSLFLLTQSIETIHQNLSEQNNEASGELAWIHYQAERLNTQLLQLLSLYRIDHDELPLSIEECFVADIIDELIAKNELYSANRDIMINIDIDPDLNWYMDKSLISHLLNDIFINALRYTKTEISITARLKEDELVVSVYDNGPGFPESMLIKQMNDVDLAKGKTGLGLYFADTIARAHTKGDACGRIELRNKCRDGKNVFSLILP